MTVNRRVHTGPPSTGLIHIGLEYDQISTRWPSGGFGVGGLNHAIGPSVGIYTMPMSSRY